MALIKLEDIKFSMDSFAYRSKIEADSMREHGRILTGKKIHYCHEWDGMIVDETTPEFESCVCYPPEKKNG